MTRIEQPVPAQAPLPCAATDDSSSPTGSRFASLYHSSTSSTVFAYVCDQTNAPPRSQRAARLTAALARRRRPVLRNSRRASTTSECDDEESITGEVSTRRVSSDGGGTDGGGQQGGHSHQNPHGHRRGEERSTPPTVSVREGGEIAALGVSPLQATAETHQTDAGRSVAVREALCMQLLDTIAEMAENPSPVVDGRLHSLCWEMLATYQRYGPAAPIGGAACREMLVDASRRTGASTVQKAAPCPADRAGELNLLAFLVILNAGHRTLSSCVARASNVHASLRYQSLARAQSVTEM